MANFQFETETIDYLIDKVAKSGITRLRLANDDFEIEIEAAKPQPVFTAAPAVAPATAAAPAAAANELSSSSEPSGNIMRSPIIGTFYSAASPDKPPFVSVGQSVKKGDVLFIVESMKLMNEIKSEYDGVVKELLVQNGESVDYNQPIMVIE